MNKYSVFLLLLLAPASAATNYTETGSIKSPLYGITSSEYIGETGSAVTVTRHHRFGEQSGIGSSTVRTTSATAESMPAYTYKPTTVSPAITLPISTPALAKIRLFSQQISSPALSTPATSYSSFSRQISDTADSNILQLPTANTDLFKFLTPASFKSKSLGQQLINPFQEL